MQIFYTYQKSAGDFKNVNGNKKSATMSITKQKLKLALKKVLMKSWIFFEASNRNTTAIPNCVILINAETKILKISNLKFSLRNLNIRLKFKFPAKKKYFDLRLPHLRPNGSSSYFSIRLPTMRMIFRPVA